MNPAAPEPFLACEVIGFVQLVLGVLYGLLWRRDREPGMGWLGVSLVLFSVWYATSPLHLTRGAAQPWSNWNLFMFTGVVCMTVGVIDYLKLPARRRRIALALSLLPMALLAATFAYNLFSTAPLPRYVGSLTASGWFAALGAMAWWARRHEPGAGHGYVAAALWSSPLLGLFNAVQGINAPARYLAFAPMLVMLLTILTTSLLRRRRALEAEVVRRQAAEAELTRTNASLEETVARRTADLQDIVTGLESFNRSVSHDLRGALGGIASLARLAATDLRQGDPALALRALPLIAQQSEHGTQLVAALLSLARVSDATLQRQRVDLRQIAQQVVEQIRLEDGAPPMPEVLVNEIPPVEADPELMRPVLRNLISNAVKFTGGVAQGRIEVGAVPSAAELTVYVRDNGVGFDSARAQRLFTPFERLHGTQFAGHGIGLSIVRRAVERHGGRVWAESQPGHGATFQFTLPV